MIEITIMCGAALGLIGVLGLVANKADKAEQKALEEYIERKVEEKLAAAEKLADAKKEESDIVAADAKTMERLG